MNFLQLDTEELAGIGIRFETEEETWAFADLIRGELEVRIGEEISSRVTKEQLDEFDRCVGQEEGKRWLERYCPDYQEIVSNKTEEFEQEIIRYKDKIAGII